MSVTYLPFDGERVSRPWLALLTRARSAGWPGHLNEGHRTFERQQFLYIHCPSAVIGCGPAAKPSPTAPHIRTGRVDHAVDVTDSQWLINFASNLRVALARTVRGESWHLEVVGGLAAFKALTPGPRTLKGGMHGADVRALVGDLMWLGYLPWPVLGRPRSYFGGWVNTAVKTFQRDYHLTADAVVGPATRRAIVGAKDARARHGWKPPVRPPLLAAAPKPAPRRPLFVPRIVEARLSGDWARYGELGDPTHLVVHHSAGPRDRDLNDAARLIQGINALHAGAGGHEDWGGFGYHKAVSTDGTVFNCRPVRWKGAHVYHQNAGKIGVVLLGNYQRDKPSAAQIQTLRWLLHDGVKVGVPNGLRLAGHRDFIPGDECPGDHTYAALPQIRRA